MKFLVALLFSLGSLTAVAAADATVSSIAEVSAHSFEYYHGMGVYKYPSGKTTNFLTSLTIRKINEDQYNFIYGIYLDNKSMHYEIVLSDHEGASFFDIMMDDKVVGYGYCFSGRCHLEFSFRGYRVEETLVRNKKDKSLSCTGSKSDADGIVKSWQTRLKKVF